MAGANYSVSLNAQYAVNGSSVIVPGTCLVQNAGGTFDVATAAVRATNTSYPVVSLTIAAPGTPFVPLAVGLFPPSLFNLGAGVQCSVRVSATGMLERAPTVGASDLVIGACDTAGTVTIMPPSTGSGIPGIVVSPTSPYATMALTATTTSTAAWGWQKPSVTIQARDYLVGDGVVDNGAPAPGQTISRWEQAIRACVAAAALTATGTTAATLDIDGGNYRFATPGAGIYADLSNGRTNQQIGIHIRGRGCLPSAQSQGQTTNFICDYPAVASGSSASMAATPVSGTTAVVSGLSGATSAWVGRYIRITNAVDNFASLTTNGTWQIVGFTNSTTVTIRNPISTGTESNNGSLGWVVMEAAILDFQTRESSIEGIYFSSSTSGRCAAAIRSTQSRGTSNLPCTRNEFRNLRISTEGNTGIIGIGITVADKLGTNAEPNNCDFHIFDNVTVDRVNDWGYCIPNATGQSKAHEFWGCIIINGGSMSNHSPGIGIWADRVSFRWYSGALSNLGIGFMFVNSDDTLEIIGLDVEHIGWLFLGYFGAGAAWPISFIGGRFDVSTQISDATSAGITYIPVAYRGRYITTSYAGPITFVGCSFSGGQNTSLSFVSGCSLTAEWVFQGCLFPDTDIHISAVAGGSISRITGCAGIDIAGTKIDIPDQIRVLGNTAASFKIGGVNFDAGYSAFSTTGGTSDLSLSSNLVNFQQGVIEITGVLTSDATVKMPLGTWSRYVRNATSGAHNVIISPASGGGASFTTTQGKQHIVFCDGTNIKGDALP